MEGHGIRMMTEVFGGMINLIIGNLVRPTKKEVTMDMPNWIIEEDVFQKLIKIGKSFILHQILGLMLETKSKSDVAINQKVNGNYQK